jgi:phosphopantothenoylcysteine decarboxylase/phosphopantothenate--cysteine ligase
MGFDVTLLRAKGAERSQEPGLRQLTFEDFDSLEHTLKTELSERRYSHVVHLAAVSDYRLSAIKVDGLPTDPGLGKIPSGRRLELSLEPTPKLIASFRAWADDSSLKVVGFKLTSGADADERTRAAARVLEASNLVIGNDVSEFDPRTGDHPYRAYSQAETRDLAGFDELSAFLTQWILNGEKHDPRA